MITTKEFQLTPKILFYLTLKKFLVVLFIAIFIIAFINFDSLRTFPGNLTQIFILIGLIVFALFIRFKAFSHPRYKNLYLKRKYMVTSDHLEIAMENGTKVTILWTNFVKAVKKKNYYLLYLSKVQFHYLPFDAFWNEGDQKSFENILIENKLV